jgi:hypothetical protein
MKSGDEEGQQGAPPGEGEAGPELRHVQGGLRFPPTRPQRTRSPLLAVRNI